MEKATFNSGKTYSIIQTLQLFVNDPTAKTQQVYLYFMAKKFRKD